MTLHFSWAVNLAIEMMGAANYDKNNKETAFKVIGGDIPLE
jgi:hypothetical protein